MEVTKSERAIDFNAQRENASFPMVVTELEIVTEVNLLQSKKALSPISSTESGMAIDASAMHLC